MIDELRRGRFIIHRFITDAMGHSIASFLFIAAGCAIDPHESRPCDIPYDLVLGLIVSCILCDFLVARFFGNSKWFGIPALLAASAAGYTLLVIVAESIAFATSPSFSVFNIGISLVGLSIYGAIFLIPATIFALIFRLMAWPIVAYFQPDR